MSPQPADDNRFTRKRVPEQGCPSRLRLGDLFEGRLTGVDLVEVSDHVEECELCMQTLNELDVRASDHFNRQRVNPNEQVWRKVSQRLVSALGANPQPSSSESKSKDGRKTDRQNAPPIPSIPGYQVIGLLGRGGMGAVYDAFHEKLRRNVAIKVLPDSFVSNQESVSRFAREMEAIGQLDHPNIVKAFDAAEQNGISYLVMERVNGLTVSSIAGRDQPMSVADACEIIRQAACGLAHAHSKGLVHRDIKPSNMMINEDGVVKLLDLGLARLEHQVGEAESELTATGRIMGTIDYMSPEQATGAGNVDAATDIYSLGASLYRLLAGHCVFHGPEYGSTFRKLNAIANEKPTELSELRKDVPVNLCQFIMRAMDKVPSQRIADANSVAQSLTPYCMGAQLSQLLRRAELDTVSEHVAKTDTRSKLSSGALTETIDGRESDCSFSYGDDDDDGVRRFKNDTRDNNSVGRLSVIFATLGVLLCGFLAFSGLGIFEIHTDNGVLVIKTVGDTFATSLKGKVVTIENTKTGQRHKITLTSDPTEKELEPGSYVLLTTASGVETLTDHFRIREGDTQEVEVWWKSAPLTNQAHNSEDVPIALSPTPPTSSTQSESVSESEVQRAIANWVLNRGGTISLANIARTYETASELPVGTDWTIGEITFQGEQFTDDDLKPITRLGKQTKLVLRHTSVGATGLAYLQNSSITQLAFVVRQVDDSILDALAQLTQLEGLDLESPHASVSRPLERLQSLKMLKAMSLSGIDLSAADLRRLASFTKLEYLFIMDSGISDDAITNIASLPSLDSLSLVGNRVTNQGIMHLEKSSKIKNIFFNEPNTTPAGINALRKAMPNDVEIRIAD
ncbi:MAG: protein kinase [Planctomycetales bacterium]|nr:protein kinase [Planctomycetales bacterium]